MIPKETLSLRAFMQHLWECDPGTSTHCVIRGIDGDHALAAVHREGQVLVFDLGKKLIEAGMAPDGPHLAQDESEGPRRR